VRISKARQELLAKEFHFDLDLLIVVDDQPNLPTGWTHVFGFGKQWIPWSLLDDEFPPLAAQFRTHLQSFDIFEQRDPVRGRQVIGREKRSSPILPSGCAVVRRSVFLACARSVKPPWCEPWTDQLDPASIRLDSPGVECLNNEHTQSDLLVAWMMPKRILSRDLNALSVACWQNLANASPANKLSYQKSTIRHLG